MAVGETGTDDGCDARARLLFGDERLDRVPKSVASRARAAVFLANEARAESWPRCARMARSTSSCVSPGSRRQSQTTSHTAVTFRAFDASTIVGAIVVASIGSTVAARTWSRPRSRSRASAGDGTSPRTVVKNLSVSGRRRAWFKRSQLLDEPRRLDERVVGDRRHGSVPAGVDPNRNGGSCLAGGAPVTARPSTSTRSPPPSLMQKSAAPRPDAPDRPGQAVVLADLLVGTRGEENVAGRLEALARERRESDRARRHLALHVERSATPHVAVEHLAAPRIDAPFAGIRDDRVGVGRSRRVGPSSRPAAARPGWRGLEPWRSAALDAGGLEVVAQELGGLRLVPGRLTVSRRSRPLRSSVASSRSEIVTTRGAYSA